MNSDAASPAGVSALIARELRRASTGWSIGVLGAVAEFSRRADEPFDTDGATRVATARGAIQIAVNGAAHAVVCGSTGAGRSSIALCLPAPDCIMHACGIVTEAGPDRDAARACDVDATLFDLGLNSPYFDFYVRTADPAAVRRLRRGIGLPLFDARHSLLRDILAINPHRVFASKLGRIEVYQRIAGAGEATPEGPHTHLLPELLRTGRVHAQGTSIPPGWIPCVQLYFGQPPVHHPAADPAHAP